ncbi:hypothetical protein [Actinoplanes sp. NPDC049599]|uniref:hypothetical protein n=1 Tax=Actinoplanes sp. NPDC049599 TaxID=3363903 RepID=UPI0037B0B1B8
MTARRFARPAEQQPGPARPVEPGTGIKVLGVAGSLGMLEELRNAFAGRGPQVDLDGPDPGDFDVGYEITGISVGEGYYIDVRVERNIIFRRKFYVVRAYQLA